MALKVVVAHNRYASGQPSGENTIVDADIANLRAAGVTVVPFLRSSDEIAELPAGQKALLPVSPLYAARSVRALRDLLRDELGVLPPGDVLKCALALARNEGVASNKGTVEVGNDTIFAGDDNDMVSGAALTTGKSALAKADNDGTGSGWSQVYVDNDDIDGGVIGKASSRCNPFPPSPAQEATFAAVAAVLISRCHRASQPSLICCSASAMAARTCSAVFSRAVMSSVSTRTAAPRSAVAPSARACRRSRRNVACSPAISVRSSRRRSRRSTSSSRRSWNAPTCRAPPGGSSSTASSCISGQRGIATCRRSPLSPAIRCFASRR